ncbi:hypothetical protein T440DRAFT_57967 [Plenodomus tracheiphilus IPT5]|uniref:Uncharacterized protein n=1 Tax=Plenodomus tracheiphilus IPT5 TaxID=1408161 RepID=A0A6A7BAL7_9PLEO|nr:hypothetical protein T440DRAFT_57967 [Plenodomus tracheiphilus IPT5]
MSKVDCWSLGNNDGRRDENPPIRCLALVVPCRPTMVSRCARLATRCNKNLLEAHQTPLSTVYVSRHFIIIGSHWPAGKEVGKQCGDTLFQHCTTSVHYGNRQSLPKCCREPNTTTTNLGEERDPLPCDFLRRKTPTKRGIDDPLLYFALVQLLFDLLDSARIHFQFLLVLDLNQFPFVSVSNATCAKNRIKNVPSIDGKTDD